MKKAIFGSVLALLAGGAVAQIEQQSRTTSNTTGSSTSKNQSAVKSKSIGTLFFPIFAQGASGRLEYLRNPSAKEGLHESLGSELRPSGR